MRLFVALALLGLWGGIAGATQVYTANQCYEQGGWDTLGNLSSDRAASSYSCDTAWTEDVGFVYSNGTSWVSPASNAITGLSLTAPSVFSVTGSPAGAGTNTIGLSFASGQPANEFLATPSGASGALGLRALVAADLPSGVSPVLSGTSGSIGGGLLAIGGCTSGTAAVSGASTAMTVVATPVSYPGDGVYWHGYVSSSNVVTVKVCAVVALTPASTAYNVRVVQ